MYAQSYKQTRLVNDVTRGGVASWPLLVRASLLGDDKSSSKKQMREQLFIISKPNEISNPALETWVTVICTRLVIFKMIMNVLFLLCFLWFVCCLVVRLFLRYNVGTFGCKSFFLSFHFSPGKLSRGRHLAKNMSRRKALFCFLSPLTLPN